MQTFRTIMFSAIVPALLVSAARAQEEASLAARIEARQSLQQAQNHLRYYWQVEYPRQRRNINAAIELTEMELKNLKTQLYEFRPFTQFSIGQPFPLTVRCLQMSIKEAELRLDNLQAERNALTRFHSDDFDALAAQVREARLHVLELEPSEEGPAELPLRSPASQQ